MIPVSDLLLALCPLHVWVGPMGHIRQLGKCYRKLGIDAPKGARFLEMFEVLHPSKPNSMSALHRLCGHVVRLRLRAEPDLGLRGLIVEDQAGGIIADLSFGISVVDAVQRFGLTAQDFAPSDLAMELFFLHESKSTAMAASFSLNARLNGARLAAETEALTDDLTGLNNRRALEGVLAQLGQSDSDYAVMQLDLDRFKQVNDRLGHAFGDAVLKRVATVLRAQTRRDDVVVRVGGDEFTIICAGLTDTQRLDALAKAVIRDLSTPVLVEDQEICIGASLGIALCKASDRCDPLTQVGRADVALYAAKRSGRGQYLFWSADMGDRLSELKTPRG